MEKIISKIGINSFWLKIIAVTTMLIDHTGAVLFPRIWTLRLIGRLAFPIFAFLLVEGFVHTKDIKKYILRIGIFALLSEIPFDRAFHDTWLEFRRGQNIFFTLGIGLLTLYFISKTKNRFLILLISVAGMLTANFLNTDYGYFGILVILCFYLQRENRVLVATFNIVLNGVAGAPQEYASISSIPILLYNGKRGKYSLKYFFYIFYPLHLVILWLIHEYGYFFL